MEPLHYIIFHPGMSRRRTKASADVLQNGSLVQGWNGYVWIDAPEGDEDPYVCSDRWLYSYCRAPQLRRTPSRRQPYVKPGSCLVFCSEDAALEGRLQVDTVFVVHHAAPWAPPKLGLPKEFQQHYFDSESELWLRHFRYGFHSYEGHVRVHPGTYTYLSRQYRDGMDDYSFLPLCERGRRVEIPFETVSDQLVQRIRGKLPTMHPVPMDGPEKSSLVDIVRDMSALQVVDNVRRATFEQNIWPPNLRVPGAARRLLAG